MPLMKNMMPTSALEAHVEQDSAVPAEYYLMENGALACQKDIKDGAIIEPQNFPVIKDLIVDKSQIEQEVKDLQLSLNPQRHDDDLNENLTPENIKNTKKVRSCIECYSCFATCPVIKFIKTKFGGTLHNEISFQI